MSKEYLERIDGKYIYFLKPIKQNPKTEIWNIFNTEHNEYLGQIRWHGAWHKYGWFFNTNDVTYRFEIVCLTDIINHLDILMKKRRKEK